MKLPKIESFEINQAIDVGQRYEVELKTEDGLTIRGELTIQEIEFAPKKKNGGKK